MTTIEDPETDAYNFRKYSRLANDFRLVDNKDDLFVINLEQQLLFTGGFRLNGEIPAFQYSNRSNNIYRWKVAGGTDFSVSYHEDKKVYQNSSVVLANPSVPVFGTGYQLVFGKPVPIYDGVIADSGNGFGNNNAYITNTPYYLVPVGVSAQGAFAGREIGRAHV